MVFIRKILFPFSFIYALIIAIRNFLYDRQIIKSYSFDFPIICVGNLSVGGTGKTPMIEYLIRLLKDKQQLAVLSRGYKRHSKGFVLADHNASSLRLGDEPYQYYRKFKNITVAVDGDRRSGINHLLQLDQAPDCILLDDAFQHRKVSARLNILLTVFNDLYVDDYLLPSGNLRDNRSQAKRADIIVVTKCPKELSIHQKEHIATKMRLKKDQFLFFSTINYSDKCFNESTKIPLMNLQNTPFTLVTGIAKSQYLVDYLRDRKLEFEHLNYSDHHNFSDNEIQMLATKKIILTTEKDYVRIYKRLNNIYYLPIKNDFLFNESAAFDRRVTALLRM